MNHESVTTNAEPAVNHEGFEDNPQKRIADLVEAIQLPVDPAQKVAELARFDADDWVSMIELAHYAVAPGVGEQHSQDAMTVKSPDGSSETILMSPDQRVAFLSDSFASTSRLLAKNKQEDSQALLDRVSNTIAMAVVCAHPYNDGNGRTARTVAGLIKLDANGSGFGADMAALSTNRPDAGFRITSFAPKNPDIDPKDLIIALLAEDIPIDDIDSYKKRVQELIATPFGQL